MFGLVVDWVGKRSAVDLLDLVDSQTGSVTGDSCLVGSVHGIRSVSVLGMSVNLGKRPGVDVAGSVD